MNGEVLFKGRGRGPLRDRRPVRIVFRQSSTLLCGRSLNLVLLACFSVLFCYSGIAIAFLLSASSFLPVWSSWRGGKGRMAGGEV